MSNSDAEPNFDLDLETAFLPAWAQKSSGDNPYAKYEGRERDYDRGERRPRGRQDGGRSDFRQRDRSPRSRERQEGGRPKRSGRPEGNRERGQGTDHQGAYRNDRRGQGGSRVRGDGGQRGGYRHDRPRKSRQEILASLPAYKVQVIPEEKGVALLARRIRLQGRAYPLFDIARLITQSQDRFKVRVSMLQGSGEEAPQELWLCRVDQTLWLNESDALSHFLAKHLDQFYQSEKTKTDPPKGNFSFVAQCSLSGVVLGPPNYHAYQAKLKELHEERFARMPFEKFKANVKVVHDEAIVAQWLEEQSWTTEYTDPKNPDAPKLHSLEEVQQHFKAHHMKGVVDRVKSAEVSGDFQKQVARPFRDLVKFYVDDQRRFPLQLATELSHQFTRQGLQFFKVNKTVTHVSVSRPHYLDLEATPVSDMVQRIVQFIDQTPDCSRAKVMQALAPSPAAEENAPAAEENAPAAEENAPAAEENAPAAEENTPVTKENAPAAELTPEQAAVSTDLHWLIHQGHVIEFSNGKMETAKKPKQPPVPTQPQKKAKKSGADTAKPDPSSLSESSANEPDANQEAIQITAPESGEGHGASVPNSALDTPDSSSLASESSSDATTAEAAAMTNEGAQSSVSPATAEADMPDTTSDDGDSSEESKSQS